MTTPQKEAVPVRFTYTPDFFNHQDKTEVILEMIPGGDPSIFDKVMAATIADERTLKAVQDNQNADFSPNPDAGYTSFKFFYDAKTGKVVKIVWEFEKGKLIDNETKTLYSQMNSLPPKVVRALYEIPVIVLGVLKGA